MPRKGWSSLETPAGMVPGHPRAASKGGAVAKAAVVVFVCLVAAHWPVTRVEVPKTSESSGAEEEGNAGNPLEEPTRTRSWLRHARRFSGCRVPSTRWATASQQKLSGWEQHSRKPAEQLRSDQWLFKSKNVRHSFNVLAIGWHGWSKSRQPNRRRWKPPQVRLTRLREEILRAPSPGPTQPAATPVQPDPTLAEVHQLRARVAEMEAEREEFRKKRARSLSVPSPEMPGASEQSVALFQHPTRNRSALMSTLIDQAGSFARSSNRYSPLV